VYQQLHAQPTDLAKNVYLEQLHDRNETLYYRVLLDHITELLPIVYDPTVGEAIERYSHEYRRPRGVYLSIDHPEVGRVTRATCSVAGWDRCCESEVATCHGCTPPMTRGVGLVGLGGIAAVHLEALALVDGVDVVAGVDPRPGAELVFGGSSRPIHASVDALITCHDLDDVIVATPTSTHAEVCERIASLDPACRILVEKPMATSEEAGEKRPQPGNLTIFIKNWRAPGMVRYWSLISLSTWPL
jgi:hypothetical protein